MLNALHTLGSRVRHSPFLERQRWLWDAVEPAWQKVFASLSHDQGFLTHMNDDVFRLEYAVGARYDRADKRAYEPVVYGQWTSALATGQTVLDVGAHFGFFSLAAAVRVGPTGRVFAFEPAPDTLATLRRHVALNRWQDRIEVVPVVASDHVGEMSFFTYRDSMAASLGLANVKDLNPEHPSTVREVKVPSTTLDRFCAERGLSPDVLKIDVEGAELLVLRGAEQILRAGKTRILCEIHPRQMETLGGSVAELERFVGDLGYRIVPIDAPNPIGIFPSWITK